MIPWSGCKSGGPSRDRQGLRGLPGAQLRRRDRAHRLRRHRGGVPAAVGRRVRGVRRRRLLRRHGPAHHGVDLRLRDRDHGLHLRADQLQHIRRRAGLCEGGVRIAPPSEDRVDVVVYAETTPFPRRGFPYDVRVATNDGLEEVLRVLQATDIRQDFQLLR